MKRNRLLTLLVLLMMAATGAWADETPLVTITFDSNGPVFSESGLVKLTGTNYSLDHVTFGYYWVPSGEDLLSATIEKEEGSNLNITKVVYYSLNNSGYIYPLEDNDAPFVCYSSNNTNKRSLSSDNWFSGTATSPRLAKIDVYGTIVPPTPKSLISATVGKQTKSMEQALPYATTIGELFETVTGGSTSIFTMMGGIKGITSSNPDVVEIGTLNDVSTPVTFKAAGTTKVTLTLGAYSTVFDVTVASPNYVALADGTDDAAKWTAKVGTGEFGTLPIGGLTGGEKVTLKYNGRLKVKSITATTDAEPAEEPVTPGTPLTMMATTAGTIKIVKPKSGMKYSVNGGDKTAITSTDDVTIPASGSLSVGDKVAFYGDGTNITSYYLTKIAGGTATVMVYGNIMSLVDEEGFATATESSATSTFQGLFDGNTTLTDASGLLLPATTLSRYCYKQMFQDCTSLTAGPAELPAPELANYCYQEMFSGCTSLTSMPELKATKLGEGCYWSMFKNCKSLTAVPAKLPVEALQKQCYSDMFSGCTGLTALPEDLLPVTTMAQYCYQLMFSGCSGLTAIPATLLKGTTLANYCYDSMFKNCSGLTTVPADLLPVETLANYCYQGMFSGCTSLTAAPKLDATALADYCYKQMFQGCEALTAVPAELKATVLKQQCYYQMFEGCKSLTTAPAIAATTVAGYSCYSMFEGCESLTAAPAELKATTLASNCYKQMFKDCTSLTTLPALKATTLAVSCYQGMFQGCISLTAVPAGLLPVTSLKNSCYQSMFQGCTSLTTVPDGLLPATAMFSNCYNGMFSGCTSLTAVPAGLLPAESLQNGCYQSMFEGCTNLTASPVLPSTILPSNCYNSMFKGCSNLASITCLAYDISNSNCTKDWVIGVAENGTFYKYASTDWTSKTGTDGIPSGWSVQND